jgi:protein SCO1/2
MRITAVVGAVVLSLAMAPTAFAEEYDRDAAMTASQAAIGRTLGNYTFRDTDGQSFQLQSLAGKPMIVSMIYTSCHHICPMITKNIEEKVAIAREAFGDDKFSVVTIGFDWRVDTAEQMRIYASSRNIDQTHWHFLSGDGRAIDSIASDVGFFFSASPKGFDHLSQTTIIDANGSVYRQVYGQDFDAPALVEPLKELIFDTPRAAGVIEHWVDNFRFFCTVYDPNSGRYLFDYSIFMTILVGIICLGAILTFIVHEWRRSA